MFELARSRTTLEVLLGRSVVTLAYPYNNNNAEVPALARRAGYRAAVLGRGRVNAHWTTHGHSEGSKWTHLQRSKDLATGSQCFDGLLVSDMALLL